MRYQIGDIMESGGMKRRVTGFSLINGESFPNTEPCEGEEVTKAEPTGKTREEIEIEIRAELEEKIRAEVMAEMGGGPQSVTGANEGSRSADQAPEDIGKDPNLSKNLTCQYCGKECGSPVGLASHERACKMNPENAGK